MSLVVTWTRQLDDPALDSNERALLCCQIAGEMERAGDYEGARLAMSGLWEHVGERPRIDGLEQFVAAEVLLRAGSLSGWIGSTRQVVGGQEEAKDLLSESASLFTELKRVEKAAEASIALGLCYWREGAFDDALVVLGGVLRELGDEQSEIRARAVLNKAMVENSALRWGQAINSLEESASLFETCNHALKGSFYNTLALAFKNLGYTENRTDYIDRALIEFAAAGHHFERAGHRPNCARVENNLGTLYRSVGKFTEAHEHLDYARRIFVTLKDSGSVAQVDETRARVFLDQRKPAEAERLTRLSVRTLETGGEQVLLVEALTTHGIALARLGRAEQARAAFERAIEIAERSVSRESAGLPALTLLEELGGRLTGHERRAAYERADMLLGDAVRPEMQSRLRACARRIFAAQPRHAEEVQSPTFVYQAAETAVLLRLAHRIAGVPSPVLISGETGTGKEELARLIHEWSGRAGEFVLVNCSALTGLPIEAHLFGYSEGTFAESVAAGVGAARRAAGGTLLFDEIAALSLADQGKLMRFIEHGEIHPIGAPEPERVDVRIIATTARNLKQEVQQGRFRDDLFYRLEAFSLLIPPLRERTADIAPLAEHFLKQACATSDKQVTFTPAGLQALSRLSLRGNARELRSLIEHTVLAAADRTVLTGEAVETLALRRTPPPSLTEPWAGCSLDEEVLRYEGELIKRALETAGGSVTRAARLLGVTHQGLAFILQGRQKNLLPARTPVRPRRRSVMRPVQR
ncbi:MAG: sigma 54-interacting transcriptional regulator [Acidobacteria bacterium]|nr:sigma 54-interacting transcriptional regulator [Acidobacteriota bacterium]